MDALVCIKRCQYFVAAFDLGDAAVAFFWPQYLFHFLLCYESSSVLSEAWQSNMYRNNPFRRTRLGNPGNSTAHLNALAPAFLAFDYGDYVISVDGGGGGDGEVEVDEAGVAVLDKGVIWDESDRSLPPASAAGRENFDPDSEFDDLFSDYYDHLDASLLQRQLKRRRKAEAEAAKRRRLLLKRRRKLGPSLFRDEGAGELEEPGPAMLALMLGEDQDPPPPPAPPPPAPASIPNQGGFAWSGNVLQSPPPQALLDLGDYGAGPQSNGDEGDEGDYHLPPAPARPECCPLVVDTYVFLTLVGMVAVATVFLSGAVGRHIVSGARRRRRREDGICRFLKKKNMLFF